MHSYIHKFSDLTSLDAHVIYVPLVMKLFQLWASVVHDLRQVSLKTTS